jgi:multidrug efflux system membrane fusion protein
MNHYSEAPDVPAAGPLATASRFSRWTWIVPVVLLLAGGWLYYSKKGAAAEAKTRPSRSTPVTMATAKSGELHVYLTALGSVTPLNTVTVRSRVDGELNKIYFTEGQQVQAGNLLAEIDPRAYEVALEQSDGQLARDMALLTNAKLDLDRYERAEAAVTQQQLATARATVAEYAGAVKADQGSVDSYKLQLSYCRIIAPLSGRVGLKLVDQGNLIHANDTTGLAVITQERPISVVFSLPEDALPALRKRLAAGNELAVEVSGRSRKKILATGTVSALDNQIDPTTGTVRLKAQFSNDDDELFPNQFVNVRVLIEVHPDALLIPISAVQISSQTCYVFVVNEAEHSVEQRTIKTGKSEGEMIAVTDGLAEGESVVTDGLDKLQDGSKISTRDPKAGGPGDGAHRKGHKKKPDAAKAP